MQVAGAPLELAADLKAHAAALYGAPLEFAALLGTPIADPPALRTCVAELGAGRYLIRAIADYGREARTGRVAFAVDELLAAGIENADLLGAAPSARLQRYLDELRRRAAIHFADAAAALAPGDRAELRHLAVLAALGQRSAVEHRNPSRADFRLSDLYNAWNTARRAANR
jgi:phytoene/squalene synthetase